MEPAKIDWKAIDSVFVPDDLYEHINAPKWIDFSALDESVDDDDGDAWFCKPDCNHPKKVEDFLKVTPPSKRLSTVFEILPLGARNSRDVNLKRRGLAQPSLSSNKDSKCDRFVEDGENQHPNFYSTPSRQYNIMKAAIKSSTEKKWIDNSSQKEERPRLKSTLSARNLFAGRDVMNQISEFCNELKALVTRTKERENVERSNGKSPMDVEKQQEARECSGGDDPLGQLDERGKERRKPLLEISKKKTDAMEKSSVKEKLRRKKRVDEAENIPTSLDLNYVKQKEGENVMPIRTCPPSPQCFSAGHSSKKGTPLEVFRSRPQERRILQEMEQSNTEFRKEAHTGSNNGGRTASIVVEKEARALDVFWFFKPCTQSS